LVVLALLMPLVLVSAGNAHATGVVSTISIGSPPKSYTALALSIAVDPVTNMVYAVDLANNDLAVIDGSSNTLYAKVPIPDPLSVAVDSATDTVYVSSSSSVYVVDGATDAVKTTIPVSSPGGIAVDSSTDLVYVIENAVSLLVINGSTDAVVQTIVAPTPHECAVNLIEPAVDSATSVAYVDSRSSCEEGNYVMVVQPGTYKVSLINGTFDPWGLAVNPSTDRIYVSEDVSQEFQVIDGSTDKVIQNVSTGSGYSPENRTLDVAVNPGNDRVYFSMYEGKAVLPVNTVSGQFLPEVPVGNEPMGVAADPSTGYVYVLNYGDDSVSVIQDSPTPDSSLTVVTTDTSGQPVSGYYTVLNYSGSMVATGFTPHAFSLVNGQTYTVQVDGYGSCSFSHWSDTGSTTFYRSVTITSDTRYDAVMRCTPTPSKVTVDSVDQNGNAISGYYVTLYNHTTSTAVAHGFTDVTFGTESGSSYELAADSYGSCTFNHWQVSGDPTGRLVFTAAPSPQTFVAEYSCASSTSTLHVTTENGMGAPIQGYYITLWHAGSVVASCFSQCSFTVSGGQTYQVEAASYGGEKFSHWQDGATGRETVNVPSSSTTIDLTATYTP
jgi:YVTN family beta-propeller protein